MNTTPTGAATPEQSNLACSPTPAHPDTKLTETYAEFVAHDREYILASQKDDWTEEKGNVAYDKWSGLFETFADTKATTVEGLLVIALATLKETDTIASIEGSLAWDGYSHPNGIETAPRQDRILWNLIESARAMTQKGA